MNTISPSMYGHAICYPQDSSTITHLLLIEIVITIGNFSRSWITYYVTRSVLNYLRCRQWATRIRALDSSPKILLPYSKVYPLVLITLLSLHCQLFLTLKLMEFYQFISLAKSWLNPMASPCSAQMYVWTKLQISWPKTLSKTIFEHHIQLSLISKV